MITFPHGFLTTVGDAPSAFDNTYSVEFDGIQDYVDVGNPTELQITSAFTVSAWVKFPNNSNHRCALSKDDVYGTRGWSFWAMMYGGTVPSFTIWNGGSFYSSGTSGSRIDNDAWHHIMGVFVPSTSVSIYVDGALSSQNTTSIPATMNNTSAKVILGRFTESYAYPYYYDGNMDEVAMWDSNQTSNLSTIYSGGVPADLSSLSPVGWWRMGDGDTYPTLTDSGSGSNDGTMNGMSSGNIVEDVPSAPFNVDFLVVAGGGAGGNVGYHTYPGGGGGAGGLRTSYGSDSGGGGSAETAISASTGGLYTVTVGAGGAATPNMAATGASGSNSVFSTITSIGGGGGGGNTTAATSGGAGGGGCESDCSGAAGTSNQGYAGGTGSESGNYGGGGGGADAVGAATTGGVGLSVSITGSAVYYAGGGGSTGVGGNGGGGAYRTDGTVNTGGGGGGTDTASGGGTGAGGSGVVILRYPNTKTITVGGGLTSSTATDGSDKVTTFTAGTDTVSFS